MRELLRLEQSADDTDKMLAVHRRVYLSYINRVSRAKMCDD